MNRREALHLISGSAAALSGQLMPLRLANAQTQNDARLVLVILRGGLDGLHALVPFSDDHYYALRPNIAVARPGETNGALDLDGRFGLHPALNIFHQLFQQGQMIAIPAASTSYRKRSHFDAQNQLENGSDKPFGADDGWLNRTVLALGGSSEQRIGLAIGTTTPLVMTGDVPIRTWSPSTLPAVDDDFLQRLLRTYDADPELQKILAQGIQTRFTAMQMPEQSRHQRTKLDSLARSAGQMMAATDGPRIAVFESHGWDTHVGQVGRLKRQLGALDSGIAALRAALAASWQKTAVLVVTEFGRTASENGSRGTDHGVGSVAFVLGGAVKGGRVQGEWPGLSRENLYQQRDLAVSTDYVSVFKGLLGEHLGMTQPVIDQQVFASFRSVSPMTGLVT